MQLRHMVMRNWGLSACTADLTAAHASLRPNTIATLGPIPFWEKECVALWPSTLTLQDVDSAGW